MAQKCKLLTDEFDDLGAINASPNAKIQGVTVVSPMKKAQLAIILMANWLMIRPELDFLDSMIMSGKSCLSINRKDSVIIGKCEVKYTRKGDKLEVMLAKQRTDIDECSNKFVVTQQEDSISCLVDLNDLEEYVRENAHVKILNNYS